jgi:hypothetical protein
MIMLCNLICVRGVVIGEEDSEEDPEPDLEMQVRQKCVMSVLFHYMCHLLSLTSTVRRRLSLTWRYRCVSNALIVT